MTINHSSALSEDLVPAQEKLEWVTPKISLMDAEDTEGKPFIPSGESTTSGPSWPILPDIPLYLQNQSSQRVCKDPFLVSCGHLRHWLPGTVTTVFRLGGRTENVIDVLFTSRQISCRYKIMAPIDNTRYSLWHLFLILISLQCSIYALTAIQVFIIFPAWCIALAKRLGDVLPFIW